MCGIEESVKKEGESEGAKEELDPSGNDIAPIYNLKIFNIFLFKLFSSSLLNYCRNCRGGGRGEDREDHESEAKQNQKMAK